MYWEVLGGLLIDTHSNTPMTPKIGDLKTPPLNYSQTVADGATALIDRHCKVIAVANAPKYSVDLH